MSETNKHLKRNIKKEVEIERHLIFTAAVSLLPMITIGINYENTIALFNISWIIILIGYKRILYPVICLAKLLKRIKKTSRRQ